MRVLKQGKEVVRLGVLQWLQRGEQAVEDLTRAKCSSVLWLLNEAGGQSMGSSSEVKKRMGRRHIFLTD